MVPSTTLRRYRSLIIDHLEGQRKTRDIGLIYIYLDHKDKDVQNQYDIRLSFIHQLARCASRPFSPLIEFYRRHNELTAANLIDELWEYVPAFLSSFTRVYFVMDGLDEYVSLKQRERTLELLGQLGCTKFSVFVTSRSKMESTALSEKERRDILIRANDDDVRVFCDHSLKEFESIFDIDMKFRKYVSDKILARADGM